MRPPTVASLSLASFSFQPCAPGMCGVLLGSSPAKPSVLPAYQRTDATAVLSIGASQNNSCSAYGCRMPASPTGQVTNQAHCTIRQIYGTLHSSSGCTFHLLVLLHLKRLCVIAAAVRAKAKCPGANDDGSSAASRRCRREVTQGCERFQHACLATGWLR